VTDRCTKSHEYVFLMAKSQRYYYDAEAVKEASAGDWTAKGGSILNNTGWTDGAGRNDQTRRPGTEQDGSTRNRRSVFTCPSETVKMRDDLPEETKKKLVAELLRRGIL